MGMTILGLILYTLMPFGQLWTRIFDYNGSTDMWWFFIPIFMMPPLQFIPVLLLYLGIIKNGKGGSPYDNYVWIPIITKLFLEIIRAFIPTDYQTIFFWISEILILLLIILTKYLHLNKSCTVSSQENSISGSKISNLFIFSNFSLYKIYSLSISFSIISLNFTFS
jgi:hypothetical protein